MSININKDWPKWSPQPRYPEQTCGRNRTQCKDTQQIDSIAANTTIHDKLHYKETRYVKGNQNQVRHETNNIAYFTMFNRIIKTI